MATDNSRTIVVEYAVVRNAFKRPEVLILLVSLWIVVICNPAFWSVVFSSHPEIGIMDSLASLSGIGLLSLGLTAFILLIFGIGKAVKPVLITMLIVGAFVTYFTQHMGILFDEEMLRNVVETNMSESMDLASYGLFITVVLLGLIPAISVVRYPLAHRTTRQAFAERGFAIVLSLLVVASGIWFDQKEIFSLARNHREIRYIFTPVNIVSSTYSYSREELATPEVFTHIATDAHRVVKATSQNKPTVHVIVLGETARAANFSLDDYVRETNPELAKLPIIYFSEATSCGTATSASLPCMFSIETQAEFDRNRSKNQDNLLDIAQRAGYQVHWRDNGNSCKGVCNRIDTVNLRNSGDPKYCNEDGCYDELLLAELDKILTTVSGDSLIVLHQIGSHGPAYSKRYPDEFQTFTPDCRSAELYNCTSEEIVNAYDNTILYTDYIVSQAIAMLESKSDSINSSLTYISDHGESLGEGGLYLHGMPVKLAPEEQTHIPMLAWFSKGLLKQQNVSQQCLLNQRATPVSHDNLFDTQLGLLEIATTIYRPEMDIFASCRGSRVIASELTATIDR